MRILSVFGTRPEAIKMAPVILKLQHTSGITSQVCVTGQHREMLDQALDLFQITPEFDLRIMRSGQTLSSITSEILLKINDIFEKFKPDIVLVHGDTTTAYATALAAFYKKIPIGHIEAGLRTGDINHPWPEEMNRRTIDMLSSILFAPTLSAKECLLAEGYPDESIFVTGNTVIDSLKIIYNRIKNDLCLQKKIDEQLNLPQNKKIILVTGHRRENFGHSLENICDALLKISQRNDVAIFYPVHMNPNVYNVVFERLSQRKNIYLIKPLDYIGFIYLMSRSYLILTDSGGIQEEAPSLGKPVLVMRNKTERPEGVQIGTVKLVGTETKNIVTECNSLLDDTVLYNRIQNTKNPYGDGLASERIISAIKNLSTKI
jgi:UDP-N-acetylglucosamine 2-epimerase (non-hydrolysing)